MAHSAPVAGVDQNPVRRHRQRGTTLLEALVAFLVLSLGMLTVARVQTQLRLNSDIARQRAEAVRLGQEDMERSRAFSVISSTPGARSYADIVSASTTIDADSGYATNTRYVLSREVDAASVAHAKATSIRVDWSDRGGNTQQVVLHSIISASNPVYSGALSLPPSGAPVKGAFGRSVRIPLAAIDLGNGTSAFKPVATSSFALIFDNNSGLVTGRCDVNPALATRDLSAADLTRCQATSALLLSGVVRFAATSLPSPSQLSGAPLPLSVNLTLSGGTYANAPQCSSEPVTGGADRYVGYVCVVYPLASGRWSGRSTISSSGWVIGTGADERKVCRYSADLDASGAVDANFEHPASYSGVETSLANQNFLVVNGLDSCPLGGAVRVEGSGSNVYANLGTALHQP